jgi:hypothetical protein
VAVLFLVVAAAAALVLTISIDHLGLTDDPPPGLVFAHQPWWSGWVRWDAGWYHQIAVDGYSYTRGEQSTVAFFPAYPLLLRFLGAGPFTVFSAGIAVTLLAGMAAMVLFARWCRRWLDGPRTWAALGCLMAWPFAFYLYGAVYSDALFLALAIAAFLLLERDRPLAAGLVGAIATATRVVGPALVVGLLWRGWERSRLPSPGPTGRHLPRWWAPALALSAVGVVAYCTFLGARFGSPFAFVDQTGVPGWDQAAGPRTWFKIRFVQEMLHTTGPIRLRNLSHLVALVAALGFLPRVVRRFGWAYGAYVTLILLVPALSSKNFLGMGRYALAAFPVFAVAGDALAERGRLRAVALVGSAACLVVTTSFFARGYYIS